MGTQDEYITTVAAVGDAGLVVGTSAGSLVLFSHSSGHDLHLVAQGKSWYADDDGRRPLESRLKEICVRGGVIVTMAWRGMGAAVWNAKTLENVAVLAHDQEVRCADICDRFIATACHVSLGDDSIRVFSNGEGYPLVHCLDAGMVGLMVFVTNDLLMSETYAGVVSFTRVSTGRPVARVDVGFDEISSLALIPNGKFACGGPDGDAAIFSLPAHVADDVKKHAASLRGASAGRTLAIDGADNGRALPPAKKQRVEETDEGSSFKLKELQAAASSPQALVELNIKDLSRVVSAVMFNFQEDWRPQLPALASSLEALFGKLSIDGGAIVEFPCSESCELLKMIMDGLKKDEVYG